MTRSSAARAISRRRALAGGLASAAAAILGARASAASSPPTLESVLQTIGAARNGLRTLRGPFTQERTIGLLSAKVKSTGTLTLVRPDRLRWELAPPDAVVYWVGPEGLAYKSARGGHGRVPPTQARIAAALEDLRLVLAGDLGLLRARYELTLTTAADRTDAGAAAGSDAGAARESGYAFSAKPRDRSSKLERIDFELDAAGSPRKVVLVEGAKDRTDIVFGALVRDAPVDPRTMRPEF
jgi:hypothetical protein